MRILRQDLRLVPAGMLLGMLLVCGCAYSQEAYERSFHTSGAAMEKALQQMQGSMAGHLPILDGFAAAGEHSLDSYERGYFQARAQVTPTSAGECVVRISAKVTAWYDDPKGVHSGYELLQSNGRIESDILDQLSHRLAVAKPPAQTETAPAPSPETTEVARVNKPVIAKPAEAENAAISAPRPHVFDTPSTLSSSLSHGLSSQPSTKSAEPLAPPDPERARLQTELEQLQDLLKNQTHPKNLAAVKKEGTAVVDTPSLNAKPLFLASAHDEFEILNFNQDWVHVRISGLSRGWIWRNDLEMPDSIPDTEAKPPQPTAADLFRVVREDAAPFPGDWAPLRGKNVKLISVQKVDEANKDVDGRMKLDFAKSVFAKSYAEMAQKSSDLAGIVLIFDSADGGMIAATQAVLQKWKVGSLSDAAFWHSCYFDPPETFSSGGNSASQ
ncbi:MAG TPA: hypothetical protein VGS27_11900 [Candidatus Sulfotelmatobacter sp.]|nr:hypothetical protein [Candidatus Sulfotelmatobacter sp.]